ncbi:hypothetical protein CU098_000323, partial [Rhizopus stolonifer]
MLITPVDFSRPYKENSCIPLYRKELSDFRQALYRNSRVHRFTIENFYQNSSDIVIDTWYTIHLKVVTEMGLPAYGIDQLITCQLLTNNMHYFITPTDLSIEYRLIDTPDSWQDPIQEKQNFTVLFGSENSTIRLQYRIRGRPLQDNQYFLHFESQQSAQDYQKKKLLSLCVGPFKISGQKKQEELTYWDKTVNLSCIQMYRALPLVREHQFIMLQEIWENGTPGKLWDSALVMMQAVGQLIKWSPDCLAGRRILDLSAGIGSLGLSIAMNCQIHNVINPPTIVLTDLEEALPLMKSNQALNHISTENTQIEPLAWGSKKDIHRIMTANKASFDYILVSDVLYNARDFSALIYTLRQLFSQNTQKKLTILMGYKPRGLKKSEEDMFFNTCRKFLRIEAIDLKIFGKELAPLSITVPYFCTNKILEETG